MVCVAVRRHNNGIYIGDPEDNMYRLEDISGIPDIQI